MNTDTIQKQVIDTIFNLLENSTLKITANTNAEEIPEWSSLKHVVILNELESVFNISFDFEDVLELTTVKEIINKIDELVHENN